MDRPEDLTRRVHELEERIRVRDLLMSQLVESARAAQVAPRPIALVQLHDQSSRSVMAVLSDGATFVRRITGDGWSWTPDQPIPTTPAALVETMTMIAVAPHSAESAGLALVGGRAQ
jgi:hypothetical protein